MPRVLRAKKSGGSLQHPAEIRHSLEVTTAVQSDPADRVLVQRARAGDREAFGVLVERYARVVHALACRQAGDGVEAQDLTQEAFLRAYAGLARLEDPDRFGAWLAGILRTTALELRRGGRRRPPRPAPAEAPPAGDPDRSERTRALAAALARLPDEARIVVTLRLVEGLDSRRIAERLGRPHGTIRSLLCRARKKLLEDLEGWEP